MFGAEWVDNAGALYCVDPSLTVSVKIPGVTISNGIVWSGATMYYIDTPTMAVSAFDYDGATGDITNKRTVFTFPADKSEGYPDGMTIDTDGTLWIACWEVGTAEGEG